MASGEQRDDRPAAARPSRRAADALARSDANAGAVRAARAARSLIPDSRSAPPGGRASDRVARLIGESRPDRPSVLRELGLGAVQVWQALVSRRPFRDDDPVPATILFTDLVGFSTWALDAGDDQVLRLLAQVNDVTESVVTARAGSVVKQLGDGSMAVFLDGTEAIEAAYEAICAVSALTIDGYRPQLRAGLHTGTPRAVGDDFLGVDVNIAARVADAAGPGELLVSDATLASADAEKYHRRRRRFKAKGVPRDLEVFAVVPRYDAGT
ncbi:adenylate/guanylate cyclase domain-containing protein [Gordonia sp. SL306]|nr:adenylate/guanylate cyclase domain-containing protein [Gordonia sp. SL306]WAC58281.1 adenylate/guanylate cyclase domain-containing protein [Gordonia sp. SL306]